MSSVTPSRRETRGGHIWTHDVLATGGTVAATADLVAKLGATVAAVLVLAELPALNPRDRLDAHGLTAVTSLLSLGDR